jgi:hypothetical protein
LAVTIGRGEFVQMRCSWWLFFFRIFLKKGLVADRMNLCAAGGFPSFKTRVTSVNAATALQLYILANANGI